jgi:hypothetical protein
MNRYLSIGILLWLMVVSIQLPGQSKRDKVEALRTDYINKRLELSTSEADKFWPVYREYNDKIRAIRRELKQTYRKRQEPLSDKDSDQLYAAYLHAKQAEAEAHRLYNERLKALIGARKVVLLHVAEEEFRVKVMRSIREGES